MPCPIPIPKLFDAPCVCSLDGIAVVPDKRKKTTKPENACRLLRCPKRKNNCASEKKTEKIMPVPTSRSQKRLHRQVRVPMIKNGRSEKKLFTQPGNVSREEAKVNRRKKKTRTRSRKRDQTKKKSGKKSALGPTPSARMKALACWVGSPIRLARPGSTVERAGAPRQLVGRVHGQVQGRR